MSDIDTSREAVERLPDIATMDTAARYVEIARLMDATKDMPGISVRLAKLMRAEWAALLTRVEAAERDAKSWRHECFLADQKLTALRAQMAWQPIEDQPEWDHRPIRQIIRAEGFKEHSGSYWHRVWVDVAYIERGAPLGYRESDLERIRKDGDMDCIERITHWKPAIFGPLPNAPEAP